MRQILHVYTAYDDEPIQFPMNDDLEREFTWMLNPELMNKYKSLIFVWGFIYISTDLLCEQSAWRVVACVSSNFVRDSMLLEVSGVFFEYRVLRKSY